MPFSGRRARRYAEKLGKAAEKKPEAGLPFHKRLGQSARDLAPAAAHIGIDNVRAGVVHRRILSPMTAKYAAKRLKKKERKMQDSVAEGIVGTAVRGLRRASVPLRRSSAGTAARLARGRVTRTAKKFAASAAKTAPRRFASDVARGAAVQTGTEVAAHAVTMRAKKSMDPEYKQHLDKLAHQQKNSKGGVRPSYESILEAKKKDAHSKSKHHAKHNAHIALLRSDDMPAARQRMAANMGPKRHKIRTQTNTEDISMNNQIIDEAADRIYRIVYLDEIAPLVAAGGAALKAGAGFVAKKVASAGAKKIAKNVATDVATGYVANKVINKISKPKT